MREKKLRLIVTFDTTAAAMAAEKLCGEIGISGRLIPVPREITAGCGMAWRSEPESRPDIERAFKEAGVKARGYYEMML